MQTEEMQVPTASEIEATFKAEAIKDAAGDLVERMGDHIDRQIEARSLLEDAEQWDRVRDHGERMAASHHDRFLATRYANMAKAARSLAFAQRDRAGRLAA